MNKISIVGASGFIGRNLCQYLLNIEENFSGFSRSICNPLLNIEKVSKYNQVPKSKFIIYLAEESSVSVVESLGDSYVEESLNTLKEIHEISESKNLEYHLLKYGV